jgi:hypothetical protein
MTTKTDTAKGSEAEQKRAAFMLRMKEIALTKGYTADNWNRGVHDWNEYFDLGYRAETARDAFDEARSCE